MAYNLYILKRQSTDFAYVGHTSNLEKRLIEHDSGKSLSTRGRPPSPCH